ncbi:hypothetical protein [Lactococcus kimchii]|uniref:hypothetical protein n=1 Tax=Lactococcus sp. S-13 TaxID=2507158 RepID=UPI001023B525|nr:hypothetical protein [Lactococcus sp. S-13]RZI49726.1 hypothetical protein EQJ87_09995 [Lactococcus sp. S-13]
MKSAQEMQDFAKQYKLGRHLLPILGNWLGNKHFKLLEQALLDDEEVKISFLIRFQSAESALDEEGKEQPSKIKWRTTQGYYAFGLTSLNRLIYAHWQPFRHTSESLMFDRLTDVKIATNLFMGYVHVGSMKEDYYLYYFSGAIKRIGKILQTAAIEHRIIDFAPDDELDESDDGENADDPATTDNFADDEEIEQNFY